MDVRIRQYCFAARLALWICALPFLLRILSLPELMQRVAGKRSHTTKTGAVDLHRGVQIALRVCDLPLFRSSFFPRACMLRSLALYRTLRELGYPAIIHFGIRKQGSALLGHSWVTTRGVALADSAPFEAFSSVYSYQFSADAT
jgi:hypothetical protein